MVGGAASIGIADVSAAFPAGRQTSADLANLTGIPEAVIVEKFGLTGKYVEAPDRHVSDLSVEAARPLLANVEPDAIDAVIYFGSPHKDYPVWMVAPKIQHLLPAPRAVAFEIGAVSCGFPIALRAAVDMMAANARWRNVILVGASVESRLIDYANPRSRFMFNFADGAAACLLQKDCGVSRVLGSSFLTDGSFHEFVRVPAGGSVLPASPETLAERQHCLDVTDPTRMKERLDPLSLSRFVQVVREAVAASGRRLTDLRLLLPLHTKRSLYHQLLSELGLTEEQGVYLDRYGHMSAVDPLVGLWTARQEGRLPAKGLLCFLSAGTGYTWGATCLEWGG
jgi:3-oxoacyl-[acyl-carrier-protein] synthase III